MGKVAHVFAEIEKFYTEHAAEHPDCKMTEPLAFPLDNNMRSTLLAMVNEGRKAGVLDDEDEIDLEVAIGTAGDVENSGWPDTTPQWQRLAVAAAMAFLAEALDAVQDPFEALMGDLASKLEPGFSPKALLAAAAAAEERATRKDSSQTDWFKHGYL